MIPGLTTRLSETNPVASTTSIAPLSDIVYVSGTTNIATIVPPFTGFSGIMVLIPSGVWHTVTTGNIAIASTAVVGKAMIMTYLASNNKWYPSY